MFKTLRELREDAPANSVGGGHIAGANGDPPVRKKPPVMRRFAGKDVFVVPPDKYMNCLRGKVRYHTYERYVGDDDTGEAIRTYGRHHKGNAIIVQCEQTGAMCFLKYGNKK